MAEQRAFLAIQCRNDAEPETRGTYLFQGDHPRTGNLVSPIFADSVKLYQWAGDNGWKRGPYETAHPVGVYIKSAE